MFNDRPADINALLSQAVMSMSVTAANAPKLPALEEGDAIPSNEEESSDETKKIEQ